MSSFTYVAINETGKEISGVLEASDIADALLEKHPQIGYLTISNALQWRLQYRRVIDKAGFGRFFGHALGHGLGLELDEPPILGPGDPTIISENMTLAVEINTIIPDFGTIKVEDSLL